MGGSETLGATQLKLLAVKCGGSGVFISLSSPPTSGGGE